MKIKILFLILILTGTSIFAQNGVIREISGTVELKTSEASPYVTANIGDQVFEDTIISTGFRSSALVELGSTLVTVRPLTRLTLAAIQISSDAESLNLNLQAGRVRVDVNPPAGTRASMSVISPMAVASVRGTSFEFDTRNLYVDDGRVIFMGNIGQRISILAGSSIGLEENNIAINPVGAGASAYRPRPPIGAEQNIEPVSVTARGDISINEPDPPPNPPPRPSPAPNPGSRPGSNNPDQPLSPEGGADFDFNWE